MKAMEEESASKKMRIYVGGLGAAMTEDDLRKVFQSVGGVVEAVDFIRTKHRSFAYVDFFPSSQSSVSKLFSTYNGCAWKGGKLRLEKAKEHYLVRLRREWEEDAEVTNSSAGAEVEVSAPESTEEVAKSEHIQIFFPSLGMVKSLPISGTGTHKYNFPHVEVPPLPVHFCDCEEHIVSPPTGNSKGTKTGALDAENDGMDEEEIKMMNAVMNKLFERRENSETYNGTMAVKGENNSMALTDNKKLEDNKVDSDEDNLVLNVMTSDVKSETMPFSSGSKIFKSHGSSKGASTDQKSNTRVQSKKRKSMISKEHDRNENVLSIPTGNGSAHSVYEPAKSSRPQPPDQAMQIHSSCSRKSSWKTLISDKKNASFSISDILTSVPSTDGEQAQSNDLKQAHSTPNRSGDFATDAVLESKKEEMKSVMSDVSLSISDVLPSVPSADEEQAEADDLNVADSTPNRNSDLATDEVLENEPEETNSVMSFAEAQQTIPNVTLNKGRGSSWRQKSSWTQLVAQETTCFSITQILPSDTSEKQVQRGSDATNVNYSAGSKNDDSKEQDSHNIAEDDSAAFVTRKEDTAGNDVKKNQEPSMQENEPSITQVMERHMPQQSGPYDVKSGETCSFMRNSRSLAEWTKIKSALSGGSKKKKQRQ